MDARAQLTLVHVQWGLQGRVGDPDPIPGRKPLPTEAPIARLKQHASVVCVTAPPRTKGSGVGLDGPADDEPGRQDRPHSRRSSGARARPPLGVVIYSEVETFGAAVAA